MIRRVRRKLAMIRYLSANRTRTPWTIAVDRAMLASLLLALPVTWITTLSIKREHSAEHIGGVLYRFDERGPLRAFIGRSDEIDLTELHYEGSFGMQLVQLARGWPLATRIDPQPIRPTLDLAAEVAPRESAHLEEDDPHRAAIDTGLSAHGRGDVREWWAAGNPHADDRPGAWIANTAIWWAVLTFASTTTVHIAHYGWLLVDRRRRLRLATRAASGRCPKCGYDQRGLEFRDRCPECGELTY